MQTTERRKREISVKGILNLGHGLLIDTCKLQIAKWEAYEAKS